MQIKADVEILEQIPLFAGCDRAHLQILAFSSSRIEVEDGRFLIRKGTHGAAGFVILEGEADVFEDAHGAGRVMARIGGRTFLGELSMITDAAYAVSVRAAGPLVAQRIERDLFLRIAAEFPEFGLRVAKNLSGKLGQSISALKAVRPLFDQG
jgi:CRP-like cAMP-binding protein